MKAHLLYSDRDFDFSVEPGLLHDDLAQDLELRIVLRTMAQGDRFLFDVSRKVVMASMGAVAMVRYRQAVLEDCLAHEDMVREMYALVVAALEDKRGIWSFRSATSSITLHGAVSQLEAFAARLRELRRIADDHVEEVSSTGFRMLFESIRRDLDDGYLELLRLHLRQLQFRDGVLMSARLGRDGTGEDYVLRSPRTRRARWRERVGLGPRTAYSFAIPPRDEAGMNELGDLTNRGLNHVANAAAQAADHIESYFSMLRAELAFYVSCLNLRAALRARGAPLTFPVPLASDSFRFSCTDLRDVSLTLQTEATVVGNDVEADGRPLVVVTGANSGGKTTFLRSVGLAQLMLQCGMFVTASSYRSSLHSAVFTHFGREEDASMRSGRLEDELCRLDAIVDAIVDADRDADREATGDADADATVDADADATVDGDRDATVDGDRDAAKRHALVLFNESFSGTNEREGSEIGRQVAEALLERGVSIFFVTHQYDLAHGFVTARSSTTRFLRAERALDGRASFRLVAAEPLPTSFALDVYRRVGGFDDNAPRTRDGAPRAGDGPSSVVGPEAIAGGADGQRTTRRAPGASAVAVPAGDPETWEGPFRGASGP